MTIDLQKVQGLTLETFLAEQPETGEILASYANVFTKPLASADPVVVLKAASDYNARAFSYVCQLAGVIAENARWKNRHLVASQVLAAASIEEGGMASRGFLDPHASLRLWTMECLHEWLNEPLPELGFADQAGRNMGHIYLWRTGPIERLLPTGVYPHAAMLGAHFASEYLAAGQEFPAYETLLRQHHPELVAYLQNCKEPNFGFTAFDWITGHPSVEKTHAEHAARAATIAGDEEGESFWISFAAGARTFCYNDALFFQQLRIAASTREPRA